MVSEQIQRLQIKRTVGNHSNATELNGAQPASPRSRNTTADHDFDHGLDNERGG